MDTMKTSAAAAANAILSLDHLPGLDRVGLWCRVLNLTAAEAGERLGVSTDYAWQIMSGRRQTVGGRAAAAIAARLDVPIQDLLPPVESKGGSP